MLVVRVEVMRTPTTPCKQCGGPKPAYDERQQPESEMCGNECVEAFERANPDHWIPIDTPERLEMLRAALTSPCERSN